MVFHVLFFPIFIVKKSNKRERKGGVASYVAYKFLNQPRMALFMGIGGLLTGLSGFFIATGEKRIGYGLSTCTLLVIVVNREQ